MKKIFIFIISIGLLSGCQLGSATELATYNDPQDRFQFSYPTEWIQTQGSDEIQFWDQLGEDNSLKMVLFVHEEDFYTVAREISNDSNAEYTYEDINEIPVLIKQGDFLTDYEIYYYRLPDDTVVSLAAYFTKSSSRVREQAETTQRSFRTITQEE